MHQRDDGDKRDRRQEVCRWFQYRKFMSFEMSPRYPVGISLVWEWNTLCQYCSLFTV